MFVLFCAFIFGVRVYDLHALYNKLIEENRELKGKIESSKNITEIKGKFMKDSIISIEKNWKKIAEKLILHNNQLTKQDLELIPTSL